MSVSGILSSLGSFGNFDVQHSHNSWKAFKQDLQQLGQDLQSGNLSAAQQDFATLQQDAPKAFDATSSTAATSASSATSATSATSSSSTQNTISQDFQQLATDLQSGDLTAASKDYAQLKQDVAQALQDGRAHVHHHHHHGGGGGEMSQLSQLFQQLGTALQSGDISSAQQVYATMQQDLQQFQQNQSGSFGSSSSANGTASPSVSVNA